jgi:sulfoxide reductase catalytic subunit YedY
MFMNIRSRFGRHTNNRIAPSEITPKETYLNRRLFMKGGLTLAAGVSAINAQA